MCLLGLIATFAPDLVSGHTCISVLNTLTIQAAGALYLGFAILNWTAKDTAIGGIYSRPVALGNLLHFFTVAMALLRIVAAGHRNPPILAVTLAYLIFTVWFGLVVFGRSPGSVAS